MRSLLPVKRLLICTVFLLFSICFAGTADLPEQSPVYPSPTVRQMPLGSLRQGLTGVPVQDERTERLDIHPISGKITFYQIRKEPALWCAPAFVMKDPGAAPEIRFRSEFWNLSVISFLIAVVLLVLAYKKRLMPMLGLAGGVFLFHLGMLFCFRAHTIYFPHPVDELTYFRIAQQICAGSWDGPWSYTLGLPLTEALLLKWFGWRDFYAAEEFLLWFNGAFLMGGSLVFAFLVLRKLFRSDWMAFGAVLTWRLAVVFHRFRDYWGTEEQQNIYKSFFSFPDWKNSYYIYMDSISNGFAALSEPLSLFCIFGILALLMQKKSWWIFLLSGAVFGFACLVRINNIFFAPLFVYTAVSGCENWKKGLQNCLTAAVGFWLIFLWQLVVNKLHFGSVFSFPYVLHSEAVQSGFRVGSLLSGTEFLMSVNYFYFMFGSISLLFVQDKYLRNVLLLWILPLTLFFCGFPEIGNNGVRFLLPVYAALLAGFWATELWRDCDRKAFWILISAVILQILLTSPSNYSYTALLPWRMEKYSCGPEIAFGLNIACPLLVLICAVLFRKNRRMALFAGCFSAAYAGGFVYLPLLILIVLALYQIFRTISDHKKRDRFPLW